MIVACFDINWQSNLNQHDSHRDKILSGCHNASALRCAEHKNIHPTKKMALANPKAPILSNLTGHRPQQENAPDRLP
jgi:hypothetical protein